jgi:hypothetical protein
MEKRCIPLLDGEFTAPGFEQTILVSQSDVSAVLVLVGCLLRVAVLRQESPISGEESGDLTLFESVFRSPGIGVTDCLISCRMNS